MVALVSRVAFGLNVSPPEAYYLLRAPVDCEVTVVVGADGRALGARAESCSYALHPAIEAAALGHRFTPGQRTEQVTVSVRPPTFQPRSPRRGECLVVIRDGVRRTEEDPRCDVRWDRLPARARPTNGPPVSWCAIRVRVADGVATVKDTRCAGEWGTDVAPIVAGWTFPPADRTFTILVGVAAREPRLHFSRADDRMLPQVCPS